MKVAIFGLGYVGCTSAACIAGQGHDVTGIDVSEGKVARINAGESPITEPGIEELIREAHAAGRLRATITVGEGIADTDLAIVCVGTPSAPDGAHNMSYIAEVTRQIAAAVARHGAKNLTVAYRSTVRPGTMEELVLPIFQAALGERTHDLVEVVYNPEFLRESSAIWDFNNPPKIVIGTRDGQPNAAMTELNKGLDAPVFNTGYREAEFTKFVDNSWHAVKVAFANEIGRLCARQGISARQIHEVFVSDTKLNISSYYMRPGGPFGGSCLPKDVRALQFISSDVGGGTHLLDSVIRSNEAHKHFQFEVATEGLEPGAPLLMVGLAFKAGTDDLRESPHIDLARKLLRAGYDLAIYDPNVDATQLVGQNLGYMYSQLPSLKTLLIAKGDIDMDRYARVLVCNKVDDTLVLPAGKTIDLGRIA
ncbi:MAG: nucleotide sugar dehydrogenase [Proteobacteria bacterium]|nr:nucleotide sugar dehydrogenase [Pseudomonadota bacterium]